MSKDQKWERVSQHVDLFRVEVPGGWIYKTLADGGATFVPRPTTYMENWDAAIKALRAARPLIESGRLAAQIAVEYAPASSEYRASEIARTDAEHNVVLALIDEALR